MRIPKKAAGLHNESDIMVDQILAWDNTLFRDEIGKLPESIIQQTKSALLDFFI